MEKEKYVINFVCKNCECEEQISICKGIGIDSIEWWTKCSNCGCIKLSRDFSDKKLPINNKTF